MGLVAPRHVGSSLTRDRTCVPCIGRQTPIHCATREAQYPLLQVRKMRFRGHREVACPRSHGQEGAELGFTPLPKTHVLFFPPVFLKRALLTF